MKKLILIILFWASVSFAGEPMRLAMSPVFLGGGAAAAAVLTLDYLQTAVDETDLTTYTFAAQNLGDAAAGRYIIVALFGRDTGTAAKTITSVTVGGQAATISVQTQTAATNSNISALAIASVPSGATGDVVLVFSEGIIRAGISLYRVTGLDSATPTDYGTSNADDPTYDIDVLSGGFAIGTGANGQASGSATWTGLTEDYDAIVGSAFTSASATFAEAQTNLTLLCNFFNVLENSGVFASWK